ncbi:MAG: ABC transporter ATP-binding protein, partial [Solirubrobacteraceae bacterium]
RRRATAARDAGRIPGAGRIHGAARIADAGRIPGAGPPAAAGEGPVKPLRFSLSKRLGSFSLQLSHVADARTLALLGPSGAGKTLTLRLLAGLLEGEGESEVWIGAERLHGLPPQRRGIAYVPQHPALMPRRTVWAQASFGVGADPELASAWLQRLGLAGLEHRHPQELSGGQQRRVALARALAIAPRVLLLDEPFTGLDAPVRDRLRRDLRRLQREASLTTVVVTHDPEEAALLADELLVIADGRLLQAGPRSEVFRAPRSPEVAALLGIVNTHGGVVTAPGRIEAAGVELAAATDAIARGSEIVWSVRPERIALVQDEAAGADAERHEAILIDDVHLGAVRELTLALGELQLTVRTGVQAPLALGGRVRIVLAAEAISVWKASVLAEDGDVSAHPTPPTADSGKMVSHAYAHDHLHEGPDRPSR